MLPPPPRPAETVAQALAALQLELQRVKKQVKFYESYVARVSRLLSGQLSQAGDGTVEVDGTLGGVRANLGDLHLMGDELMNAAAQLRDILDALGVPK